VFKKTHIFNYIIPISVISKGVFPYSILCCGKRAFNIDNSANPLKRKATGSDNRAFLYFYGTALPRVERQNWRG
jgi:hypothetical protein